MDNKDLQLSIIIPVYEVEPYIRACVDSVLSQTYTNFEVILVDDGSPDSCGAICDEYARKDACVKVIHKENGGLSSARNAGIQHASGTHILFLDSDDLWTSESFLQEVVYRLRKTDPDVLTFNYRKIYEDHTDAPYFPAINATGFGTLEAMIYHDLWIACAWNKVVRRTLFANNALRFIEGVTAEDIDWSVRLALQADRFDYLDLCGVYYRQRQGSITESMSAKKVECLHNNILRCIELTQNAAPGKAQHLRPFLAYQVGTLLQSISQLPDKTERSKATQKAKPLLPLLSDSNNAKVKLLHYSSKLTGIRGCIALLRMRNRMR